MKEKRNGTQQKTNPIKVFISYSHDSEKHRKQVLELAKQLTKDGIFCILDQNLENGYPKEGWALWAERRILKADSVLIICTEGYYNRVMGKVREEEGRGVKWEATSIYNQIFKDNSQIGRFIPVLFNDSDEKYIPPRLSGVPYYCINTENGSKSLYSRLTNKRYAKEELESSPLPKNEMRRETKEKKSESSKKFIIYLIMGLIIAILAFIVFDPLGIIPGKGKGKIDYSEKIEGMKGDFQRLTAFLEGGESNKVKLEKCQGFLNKHQNLPENDDKAAMVSETNKCIEQLEAEIKADEVAKKQIDVMKGDFETIKKFLESGAAKKEKIDGCQKFLEKHKNTPGNENTKSIVSETNKYIDQLEAGIKADEEYKKHIASAKEYTKKKDYEKAADALEKAKAIKHTKEIDNLSVEITNKQIEKMKGDFKGLKGFLKDGDTNNEKRNKCQEFLDKFKKVTKNSETKSMISEITYFLYYLDTEIAAGIKYQKHIDSANKFIRIGNYKLATNELEKAKSIRYTNEVKKLSNSLYIKKLKSLKRHSHKIRTAPPKEEKVEKVEEVTPKVEKPQLTNEELFQRLTLEELNRMGYLRRIYFDFDQYFVRADMKPILESNAKCLLKHNTVLIRVDGYTDDREAKEYGMNRAKAAKAHLVVLGVAAERIKLGSYGKNKPLVKNVDEDTHFKNRRVEFTIIKK